MWTVDLKVHSSSRGIMLLNHIRVGEMMCLCVLCGGVRACVCAGGVHVCVCAGGVHVCVCVCVRLREEIPTRAGVDIILCDCHTLITSK